ncbi:MAG TPA: DUF1476 domain-containing protein [Afifellaceae bacterium]|nr:DUF1476 domain-containing protein [Afifellaceae bacterium]
MTTFNNREKAFEDKFARDEALRFKAEARRNKLLGQWAAELLGKSGDAVEEYVREVVRSDFEEPGDEDVFRKVRGDLDEAGVSVSDEELRDKMVDLLGKAIDEIEQDG